MEFDRILFDLAFGRHNESICGSAQGISNIGHKIALRFVAI